MGVWAYGRMGIWAYGIWVGIWDWDGLMGLGWGWGGIGIGIWAYGIWDSPKPISMGGKYSVLIHRLSLSF